MMLKPVKPHLKEYLERAKRKSEELGFKGKNRTRTVVSSGFV